jgi:hypothetical protein
MEVFWLIAFGRWRAIECYSPHVILSATHGRTVAEVMALDAELDDMERGVAWAITESELLCSCGYCSSERAIGGGERRPPCLLEVTKSKSVRLSTSAFTTAALSVAPSASPRGY